MELYNYKIQSNEVDDQLTNSEYSCEYSIDMSYGKYVWCGNRNAPNGYGFTLTNSSNTDIYGNPNTYAMLLKLKLTDKLVEDCEFYEIYDSNGGLFQYNIEPLQKEIIIFNGEITSDIIETELKIIFSKKKQLTKEQEEIVHKRLMRTPKVPVYTIKITVPNILQFGELNECNICLDSVTNNNKYISPCGHLFHLNCVFEYLEKKNLLYPIHPRCEKSCCGAKKIKQFNCVVCDKKIH